MQKIQINGFSFNRNRFGCLPVPKLLNVVSQGTSPWDICGKSVKPAYFQKVSLFIYNQSCQCNKSLVVVQLHGLTNIGVVYTPHEHYLEGDHS